MDQFLKMHMLGTSGLKVNIGPEYFPGSIRDQMVRARMVVERLLDLSPSLAARNRPLLVIGGGVAGATVAMSAAACEITTYLVERESEFFTRQASAFTRWISPVAYDWPLDHWKEKSFPEHARENIPLFWEEGIAAGVVGEWRALLKTSQLGSASRLVLRPGARVVAGPTLVDNDGDRYLYARIAPGQEGDPNEFAMAVFCRGHEDEGNRIRDDKNKVWFTGYRFWETDKLENDDLGMPVGTIPRVLISGGGDGGLQDLIRIMVPRTPIKEIFRRVVEADVPGWDAILRKVHAAEDQAQRAYSWGSKGPRDHAILSHLHSAYEDIVDQIASDGELMRKIWIDSKLLVRTNLSLTFIHRCNHFGRCYALNRFIGLLLIKHLEMQSTQFRYRQSLALAEIAPGSGDHRCGTTADECHGQNHAVKLMPSVCRPHIPLPEAEVQATEGSGNYNGIVVRHGPHTGNRVRARRSVRQLLPYYP